jgi:ABC-type cobalamin/Fe3+-siderophores transport system ATPase subunit
MSLELSKITFSHGNNQVLKGVDLRIETGTFAAVLGPNGAGKSTLAKIVARIHRPETGTVLANGVDIFTIPRREHARLVAYVPQSSAVPFELTVADSVLLGRTPHIGLRPSAHDHQLVTDALQRLDLTPLRDRRLSQLSGGQAQRVLIARALVQEPKVLLLDEPTSALDLRYQVETLQLVQAISAEEGVTSLIVIHDLNMAAAFCDQVVLLDQGVVAIDGPPAEVLDAEVLSRVYGLPVKVFKRDGHVEIRPEALTDSAAGHYLADSALAIA